MAESASIAPRAMAGKGKRVVGTFLVILGAGMVLESARWIGGVIVLAGAGALLRGLLEAQVHTAVDSQPRVAIDPQTESRL
jgi:hypothetical protein